MCPCTLGGGGLQGSVRLESARNHTAHEIAIVLGKDPAKLTAAAEAAAEAGGFCVNSFGTAQKCTEEQIRRWAESVGHTLSGSLGLFAQVLSGSSSAMANAVDVVAGSHGSSSAQLRAEAGLSASLCANASVT